MPRSQIPFQHNLKIKITVYWDVTSCSLVGRHQRFRGTFGVEDGRGRFLRDIGTHLPHYAASHPRRILCREENGGSRLL
jgi:hypothetical protein